MTARPITTLLVANRGEIAVRIMATAAALGMRTVAVHPVDDVASLHVSRADVAVELPGAGPAAYLDIDAIVDAAVRTGCEGVHPGYGFLSENAAFARRCTAAGLVFVGPDAEALALFGDKTAARARAAELGIPVPAGAAAAQAHDFLAGLGPGAAVMVKARSGGGGRGMRPVTEPAELDEALRRSASEAESAFGDGTVYVEQLFTRARHIEVQVAGDGHGAVALGDRDCSAQRRRQKLVEIAPAPAVPETVRGALHRAATDLTGQYRGLATVEFLVTGEGLVFLEVNPRLQVEHTVTEEVTGLDLVEIGLELAAGKTLAELGLDQGVPSRGTALQVRVNAEIVRADGTVAPGTGTLTRFQPPAGHGIRVDTHGYAGYAMSPRYDSLLAKVIVHGSIDTVAGRADRALAEFDLDGVVTNIGLLRVLLAEPALITGGVDTAYVDTRTADLVTAAEAAGQDLRPACADDGDRSGRTVRPEPGGQDPRNVHPQNAGGAGKSEPTGSFAEGRRANPAGTGEQADPAEHAYRVRSDGRTGGGSGGDDVPANALLASQPGVVAQVSVSPGDQVVAGSELLVLEAMKMEHVVRADRPGTVDEVLVKAGDAVAAADPLLIFTGTGAAGEQTTAAADIDPAHIRPDLAEVHEREQLTLDAARPAAVQRRHGKGLRTARENIADLVDPGSFTEYGGYVIAAQRRRRDLADLITATPADGLITGTAAVDGVPMAVLAYDYTVLAGTQGVHNHRKTDRLLQLARRRSLPVVVFAEGGGGRPGDTDTSAIAQLDVPTFRLMAELSGKVPTVAIVAGYCFAGNAALAASCDLIIATEGSSLGMSGPAMIEGAGLGVVAPQDVGPMSVQVPNGVVDVLVPDEAAAVATARTYLRTVTGVPAERIDCADQRLLRHLVPESRVRVYAVRPVLDTLFDIGSVLEVRAGFGTGIVTAFARLAGRPVGVLANDPSHLGGAIDGDAADKATRFLRLCDERGLPVVSLVDTPGFMVGPDAERTATVRRFGAMFVAGAQLTTPLVAVVLRKGYGLGAMAMTGGDLHAATLTVAWPTGEFGGMGLEGAVRLGYRKELEAIADPGARRARYEELLAGFYERGKALSVATVGEIDDVIDPADTRDIVLRALTAAG
ncbi:acetyl-CoA carboxylase family protein [Nocardia carnea]|uniref:acetyl-CoA carboxylase family protein n=1 Tax=Nocardia carnea TaxID=37328 RepID=UPI002458A167|nr:carboxyl transferase domain-containing protein [Nocardia carnea]